MEVFQEIDKYMDVCNTSSGNIFWLGAKTLDWEIFVRDEKQSFEKGNFTNWAYPLYEPTNQCIMIDRRGKWNAIRDCRGSLDLCPLCGFVGTPILTLKGKSVACLWLNLRKNHTTKL